MSACRSVHVGLVHIHVSFKKKESDTVTLLITRLSTLDQKKPKVPDEVHVVLHTPKNKEPKIVYTR